jgi:hypothetical protein
MRRVRNKRRRIGHKIQTSFKSIVYRNRTLISKPERDKIGKDQKKKNLWSVRHHETKKIGKKKNLQELVIQQLYKIKSTSLNLWDNKLKKTKTVTFIVYS